MMMTMMTMCTMMTMMTMRRVMMMMTMRRLMGGERELPGKGDLDAAIAALARLSTSSLASSLSSSLISSLSSLLSSKAYPNHLTHDHKNDDWYTGSSLCTSWTH